MPSTKGINLDDYDAESQLPLLVGEESYDDDDAEMKGSPAQPWQNPRESNIHSLAFSCDPPTALYTTQLIFYVLASTAIDTFAFSIGQNMLASTTQSSASAAAGACVGGLIWGGACMTLLVALYHAYGRDHYDKLKRLGIIFWLLSMFVAPHIGAAVLKGRFKGGMLVGMQAFGATVFGFIVSLFVGGIFCIMVAYVHGWPSKQAETPQAVALESLQTNVDRYVSSVSPRLTWSSYHAYARDSQMLP